MTTPDEVLASISKATMLIEKRRTQLSALVSVRTDLFRAGRALVPPVTFKAMADAAGMSDAAVHEAIGRAG